MKTRLYEFVTVPKQQLKHDRLWTSNNCEFINHVFKRAIDWKPKPIPELIKILHEIVKVQFADMKRALYGTGNYELHGKYRKHLQSHQAWYSKTPEQQEGLLLKLMTDIEPKKTMIKASSCEFEVPLAKRLARKPYQTSRPRSTRTKPRYQ